MPSSIDWTQRKADWMLDEGGGGSRERGRSCTETAEATGGQGPCSQDPQLDHRSPRQRPRCPLRGLGQAILQLSGCLPSEARPHAVTSSVQFSSVTQSCPNLCNSMDCSTPGFPVHHRLPELTQTHVPRTTEDEMAGWHHQLDGHEFDQALGVGDGQGSLACYSPQGRRESDTTERLN